MYSLLGNADKQYKPQTILYGEELDWYNKCQPWLRYKDLCDHWMLKNKCEVAPWNPNSVCPCMQSSSSGQVYPNNNISPLEMRLKNPTRETVPCENSKIQPLIEPYRQTKGITLNPGTTFNCGNGSCTQADIHPFSPVRPIRLYTPIDI